MPADRGAPAARAGTTSRRSGPWRTTSRPTPGGQTLEVAARARPRRRRPRPPTGSAVVSSSSAGARASAPHDEQNRASVWILVSAAGANHAGRLPAAAPGRQRALSTSTARLRRSRVRIASTLDQGAVRGRVQQRVDLGRHRRSSISKIQPSPYGSGFTSSGVSVSASFTARTTPDDRHVDVGDRLRRLDLADGSRPRRRRVPTSGSCTNTTSPRLSCAKSVMPIARDVAVDAHPLVLAAVAEVLGNVHGPEILTSRAQRVSSATWPAWIATRRRASASLVAFGPHVGDRELGVGQHERPAVGVHDLHAVDEHGRRVLRPFHHAAHHRALALPRRRHRLVRDVRSRAPRRTTADSGRSAAASRSSRCTSVAAASYAGRNVGPDEAAFLRRREVDVAAAARPP